MARVGARLSAGRTNLMNIMNEISYLGPHIDEINTLSLDDPELCKYPVASLIEVGWWTMTDREATALRECIQRAGSSSSTTSSFQVASAAVDGTTSKRT